MRNKARMIYQSVKDYKAFYEALGLHQTTIRAIIYKWRNHHQHCWTFSGVAGPLQISPKAYQRLIHIYYRSHLPQLRSGFVIQQWGEKRIKRQLAFIGKVLSQKLPLTKNKNNKKHLMPKRFLRKKTLGTKYKAWNGVVHQPLRTGVADPFNDMINSPILSLKGAEQHTCRTQI